MKKNKVPEIRVINKGNNIPETEKNLNKKVSKRKTILIYTIPLVILVIVGFIYIFTQINILLIPFAILMFIVLIGWDGATRTCPNCKMWNSVAWIKSENISEIEELKENKTNTTKTDKKVARKKNNKSKKMKIKYTINQGKCKKCGCIFERKKQRLF